ncbi:hypothetical protein GNI_228530, partial [Gregarina niphandrodes]
MSTQENVGSQVVNQYWGELDIRLQDKEIHMVTGVVLPEVHQLILGLPYLIGHNARLHMDEYQGFEMDTQPHELAHICITKTQHLLLSFLHQVPVLPPVALLVDKVFTRRAFA